MTKQEDYNNVPVAYCDTCMSLKVVVLTDMKGHKREKFNLPPDYCGECGHTTIKECHIEEFKQKYKNFYGKDHLTGNKQMG